MTIFWPALLAGLGSLAGGVLLVRHRDRVARANAQLQQETFGDGPAARRNRRRSTGRTMGRVGGMWMAMGLALVVLSFLGLDW